MVSRMCLKCLWLRLWLRIVRYIIDYGYIATMVTFSSDYHVIG